MTVCFVLMKENMGDLQENLRNVEDKLSAAETCKTMLNEEVLALRLAYDKLSSDLEVSQSERSLCLSDTLVIRAQTIQDIEIHFTSYDSRFLASNFVILNFRFTPKKCVKEMYPC